MGVSVQVAGEVPVEAAEALRFRLRRDLDELDYRRRLRRLVDRGYSQGQIAGWVGVSQPAVASALRTATRDRLPVKGFSGATPLEIIRRYAAGQIDADRVVTELTAFPYVQEDEGGPWDDPIVAPAGGWWEVSHAFHLGLLELDVYSAVFDARVAAEAGHGS